MHDFFNTLTPNLSEIPTGWEESMYDFFNTLTLEEGLNYLGDYTMDKEFMEFIREKDEEYAAGFRDGYGTARLHHNMLTALETKFPKHDGI